MGTLNGIRRAAGTPPLTVGSGQRVARPSQCGQMKISKILRRYFSKNSFFKLKTSVSVRENPRIFRPNNCSS